MVGTIQENIRRFVDGRAARECGGQTEGILASSFRRGAAAAPLYRAVLPSMQKMLVRVAVVQAGSILFDRDRTIEKASDFARDAAARGAKLVVFPEAFVGGYPKGFDFGARVGSRSAEGREQFREYFDSSARDSECTLQRSRGDRTEQRNSPRHRCH